MEAAGALVDFPCMVIRGISKRWLDEPANDRWLLIYDNYDHPMASINTQRSGRQNLSEGNRTDEKAKGDQDQISPNTWVRSRFHFHHHRE
jgi:hypothetical protein